MEKTKKPESKGLTRRDLFKVSGLALGGMALGGVSTVSGPGVRKARAANKADTSTQQYSYFDDLPEFYPGEPLDADEMRITFLGSSDPPPRLAQSMMSIFVEVGDARGEPDQFIFDCGSGVVGRYNAAKITFARMDKIFLTHLHGDHMSDLTHIYCFGPSVDRKSPLYVWGPGPSRVKSPMPPRRLYDDGTKAYCENLRAALRWHTESFSFQPTSYESYKYKVPTRATWGLPCDPVPVGDDDPMDAYALVPIELDWTKYGEVPGDNVAYENQASGVRITHFPVIHCRKGSIGYKLEWNGLSMIYTGDTKPEYHSIEQACNDGNGVDVFIHEMVVPADVWALKTLGIDDPSEVPPALWKAALNASLQVQNSSHTSQGAFGYLLTQIDPLPRLAVATHFPVEDDTVNSALESVRNHCPGIVQGIPNGDPDPNGNITWSFDITVINVSADHRIRERKAVVSPFTFGGTPVQYPDVNTPKYHTADGKMDPYAQIDRSTEVPAKDPETGEENYREDGY
ncbi:MAG: MBL fold metallo-hydrolase [Desulfatiglandales bacterium]